MLNNITNFFNLIATRKIKTKVDPTDLLPIGTRDSRYTGCYQPTAILACDFANQVTCNNIIQCDSGQNSSVRVNNFNTASGAYTTALGRCNTAAGIASSVLGGKCNTANSYCYSTVVNGTCNVSGTPSIPFTATESGLYNCFTNYAVPTADISYIGLNFPLTSFGDVVTNFALDGSSLTLCNDYSSASVLNCCYCQMNIATIQSISVSQYSPTNTSAVSCITYDSLSNTTQFCFTPNIPMPIVGCGVYSFYGNITNLANDGSSITLDGDASCYSNIGTQSAYAIYASNGTNSNYSYSVCGSSVSVSYDSGVNTSTFCYSPPIPLPFIVPGSCFSSIGNGSQNTVSCNFSTIVNGKSNTISGVYSFIAGGYDNTVNNYGSFALGVNITTDRDLTTFVNDLTITSMSNCTGQLLCVGTNGLLQSSPGGGSIFIAGSGNGSSLRYGVGNNASGNYSASLGGCNNTASGNFSTVTGGRNNTASWYYSSIVGGLSNCVTGEKSTIAGGSLNTLSCAYSYIGGGSNNRSCGVHTVIGGGRSNIASLCCATISGGTFNTASGMTSFIGGGDCNIASNSCSSVGGGSCNISSSIASSIFGGRVNTASGFDSIIGGGYGNRVTCDRSAIVGGCYNLNGSIDGFIGGGNYNVVCNSTSGCLSLGATVAGGVGNNTTGGTWSTYFRFWTVLPTICNAGQYSFIGGGFQNQANGNYSAILGGQRNNVATNANTFIVGSCITSNRACSTFVNNLNIMDIPTSNAGLPSKSLYYDAATCVVKIIP
jgi:hypothetical protein